MTKRTLSFIKNENLRLVHLPDWLDKAAALPVRRFHLSMDAFGETALVSLPRLAAKLGVKAIFIKDESTRFGLKAFKALGASWAIARVIADKLGLDWRSVTFSELKKEKYQEKIRQLVFAATTDGNHGKGVAWTAKELGCKAHIFMPKGTVEIRRQAIIDAGATDCTITDRGYDDTVRFVRELAAKNGWTIVQDTSWAGYEDVPRYIVQGYTTMVQEALEKIPAKSFPTHVFLQAGVGSMAGSAAGYLMNYAAENQMTRPLISVVEATAAACFYESMLAKDGLAHPATGDGRTIMAGLNCAEAAPIIWPLLRDFAAYYFAIEDSVAAEGMRQLAHPAGDDPPVTAGESGAAGFGTALHILTKENMASLKRDMGLNENSVILCFNTEGATDPENYRRIVEEGAYPAE